LPRPLLSIQKQPAPARAGRLVMSKKLPSAFTDLYDRYRMINHRISKVRAIKDRAWYKFFREKEEKWQLQSQRAAECLARLEQRAFDASAHAASVLPPSMTFETASKMVEDQRAGWRKMKKDVEERDKLLVTRIEGLLETVDKLEKEAGIHRDQVRALRQKLKATPVLKRRFKKARPFVTVSRLHIHKGGRA